MPGASRPTLEGMPLIKDRSVEAFNREVGDLRWPVGCPRACLDRFFQVDVATWPSAGDYATAWRQLCFMEAI